MWSKSTKPCPIITWDGVVFNGEHHYVDHIYYMIHARPFGLSVLRPYMHMLGSSSLTWVFYLCKTGLHPLYVNVELITPNHHVVSRHDELSQWCILRENTCTLKFSERSSYNAIVNQSKIRCIKDKHHMQSNISDMICPSSSCAFNLHLQSTVMITIVTGLTPWSPSKHHCRHANYCLDDYRYRLVIK